MVLVAWHGMSSGTRVLAWLHAYTRTTSTKGMQSTVVLCSPCTVVVQYYSMPVRSTPCACSTGSTYVAMYWYMEAYSSTRPSTLPSC